MLSNWLALALTSCLQLIASSSVGEHFTEIVGLMCVKSQFIETWTDARTQVDCALRCADNDRCQAFNMIDGPCQLFVFDKCSKYVRECGPCAQSGRVFVKQRRGLPAGALCPVGFANDLCGTKYKLVQGATSWNFYKSVAESLPGLVIMSDVLDQAELAHQYKISMMYGWTAIMHGGIQSPGSDEPTGGFRWVSCDLELSGSGSLWVPNEPNNWAGAELVVTSETRYDNKLLDNTETNAGYTGGLMECVSPFD